MTEYTYPLSSSTYPIEHKLIKHSFCLEPVKITNYLNGIALNSIKKQYRNTSDPSLVVPHYEIEHKLDAENHDTITTYLEYSNAGTLLKYKQINQPVTHLVWDENKLFLMASITGDVPQLPDLSNTAIYDSGLIGLFNTYRSANTQAQVTSYTYDLAGNLHSKTLPNGETYYYLYDDMNRLSKVLDYNNKLIKKIDYQYKTFTK